MHFKGLLLLATLAYLWTLSYTFLARIDVRPNRFQIFTQKKKLTTCKLDPASYLGFSRPSNLLSASPQISWSRRRPGNKDLDFLLRCSAESRGSSPYTYTATLSSRSALKNTVSLVGTLKQALALAVDNDQLNDVWRQYVQVIRSCEQLAALNSSAAIKLAVDARDALQSVIPMNATSYNMVIAIAKQTTAHLSDRAAGCAGVCRCRALWARVSRERGCRHRVRDGGGWNLAHM